MAKKAIPTFWSAAGHGKTQKSAKNRRVFGIKSGLDSTVVPKGAIIQLCQIADAPIYLKLFKNLGFHWGLLSSWTISDHLFTFQSSCLYQLSCYFVMEAVQFFLGHFTI
jgi:hypothetical protein